MIERTLIVILVVLVVAAGWVALRLWGALRLRWLRSAAPFADIVLPGRPAVVAFSTPFCSECRSRQAPALARLAARFGSAVTVRSLSAPDHPALVRRMGIITVPATVVVDAAGTVRHLNLGYTSDDKLRAQVLAI